jgi:hypothetical protein
MQFFSATPYPLSHDRRVVNGSANTSSIFYADRRALAALLPMTNSTAPRVTIWIPFNRRIANTVTLS